MTPHIESKKYDIAPLVIMPGDPIRAKKIAEKFLKDYKLVNSVRGQLAFTGYYKDKIITVMSSGMGIPSMGIYSYELFKFYDVDVIIRVGSCGSYIENIKIGDIILLNDCYSTSNYAKEFDNSDISLIHANKELNEVIMNTSKEINIDVTLGNVHTTESFYGNKPFLEDIKNNKKCLVTEMESYSLLYNASKLNKKACTLLTVTDEIYSNEALSSEERENNLFEMINLAFESIIKM